MATERLLQGSSYGQTDWHRLSQAIVVGDQEYAFQANEETCCDLLRVPVDRDDCPAQEVAQIRQKLQIQVNVAHFVSIHTPHQALPMSSQCYLLEFIEWLCCSGHWMMRSAGELETGASWLKSSSMSVPCSAWRSSQCQ